MYLSVCMSQLENGLTNFRKILYYGVLLNCVDTFKFYRLNGFSRNFIHRILLNFVDTFQFHLKSNNKH
jgi:hypothetical protein